MRQYLPFSGIFVGLAFSQGVQRQNTWLIGGACLACGLVFGWLLGQHMGWKDGVKDVQNIYQGVR